MRARLAGGGFLLFAGLAAVSRLSSFRTPLSEDTGVYLYIGDVILDGGTPYVDAADNKGPLTYLLFAGIRLVAGRSTEAVRISLLLFAALTALAVAAYVCRFAGRAAGAFAGCACAVLGSTYYLEGADPNTEQYGVAPMALAWWLSAAGTRRAAAGAGALTAAAVLMNPGFAPIVLVVAVGLWFQGEPPERAKRFAAALAGAVAATAPFVIWLLAAGGLDDFWTQVIGKNTVALTGDPDRGAFASRPLFDFEGRGLYVLGAGAALLAMTRPGLRLPAATSLLWIVAMWLRVKAANYEFLHHYYLAIPGIAAAMGLALAAMTEPSSALPRRVVTAGAVAVLAVTAWVYVGRVERDKWRLDPDERVTSSRYATAYPVGDFIRSRTGPDDRIFVAGNNATVYWRADRRAPTRFFADYPLVRRSYRGERVRELAAHPPAVIATMPGGSVFLDDTRTLVDRLPYRLIYDRDGAKVWELDR